jgi:hypothetical protein
MKKIPIGPTIASAYGFTFGGLGTVIGLIWIPFLLYTVGRFLIGNYTNQLVSSGDPTSVGRSALVAMGFSLVSVFLIAVIGVSLTRQVMSPRNGSVIAHFAVGTAEFNYFLSLLAVFFVMLVVYIAAVIADLVVIGIATSAISTIGPITGKTLLLSVAGAIVLLDFSLLIYIGVRLGFLVAPVTVVEGKIDLVRAWQLTRGNFWRMFVVLAVTLGPILVVSQLAVAAIVGPNYIVAFASAMLTVFQAVVTGGQPQAQVFQHLPDITAKVPWLLGVSFLLAPFTYGLTFAAPAFAYRALVGTPPPSQAPDVGPFRPA